METHPAPTQTAEDMKNLYAFVALMVLLVSVAIAGDTPQYVGDEWLSGAGSASNTLDMLNHTNNDNGKPVEIYTFGSVGGTTTFTLYYRDIGNNVNQTVTMTMVDGMPQARTQSCSRFRPLLMGRSSSVSSQASGHLLVAPMFAH